MNAFLSKPVTVEVLLSTLRRWLPSHFPRDVSTGSNESRGQASSSSEARATQESDLAAVRSQLVDLLNTLDPQSAEQLLALV
jgi:hypothetical protein